MPSRRQTITWTMMALFTEANMHYSTSTRLTHWGLMTRIHQLTHWGRVTHICVSKLIIIGSDNGLSPGRRQAIIWTNAGILLIGPLGTNFSEISIEIHTFPFKKMHLNMSSAKWRLFRPGLDELIESWLVQAMACHLFSTNPLPGPMLTYCQLNLFGNKLQWTFDSE